MLADLMIGFQVFREKFRSNVNYDTKNMIIEVSYEDGPFKFLTNKWEFKSYNDECIKKQSQFDRKIRKRSRDGHLRIGQVPYPF